MERKKREKKRNKTMRETHLAEIARLERLEPFFASSLSLFIPFVSKKLKITESMAKKDILEVHKREREKKRLDYNNELNKKILEFALIKEAALKQSNLNAYLGAVKAEAELLGLSKLNIFKEDEQKDKESLEEKKRFMIEEILKMEE